MNNIPKARNRTLSSDTRLFFSEKRKHTLFQNLDQNKGLTFPSTQNQYLSVTPTQTFTPVSSRLDLFAFHYVLFPYPKMSPNSPGQDDVRSGVWSQKQRQLKTLCHTHSTHSDVANNNFRICPNTGYVLRLTAELEE